MNGYLNYPVQLLATPPIISMCPCIFTLRACTCVPPKNLTIPPMSSDLLPSLGPKTILGGDSSFALEFPKITDMNLLNLLP